MNKTACNNRPDISKKTVIASFQAGTTTRIFLESIGDENWEVTSFMPESRTVCAVIFTAHGMNHLSLTLPPISASSL